MKPLFYLLYFRDTGRRWRWALFSRKTYELIAVAGRGQCDKSKVEQEALELFGSAL